MARKLKAEVAAKYKLVTVKPGRYDFHRFGHIDLEAMSLARADALHAAGFPFLVLKAVKGMAKKTAS